MMLRKFCAGILLACMLLTSAGCHKKIQTEPPVVVYQRTLLSAADAVDSVSIALVGVHDAVIQLEAADQIDHESARSIHTWLSNIGKANDKAVVAIRLAKAGGESVDWKAAVANVVTEASKLDPSVFAIKNEESKATFHLAVSTLQSALVVLQQLETK